MMRFVAVCLAALVSVAAAGGAPLALGGAASPSAVALTVSNASGVVDGDVSSPAALIAHPGPDGISLPEALAAADNAPGRHTIRFARSLAGKTITPSESLSLRAIRFSPSRVTTRP